MSWSLTPSDANPLEGLVVFAGALDFGVRAGDLDFDLLFERFFWSPRYWVVPGVADIVSNVQRRAAVSDNLGGGV
jgi:hypothetical protein